MTPYRIEACVESATQAIWAQAAGADQIELCSRLDLDGLTPSRSLVQNVVHCIDVPVKVMIRPHPGSFVYDPADRRAMHAAIAEFATIGVRHFVTGGLTADGSLDRNLLDAMLDAFPEMTFTVHKVIDLCHQPISEILWLASKGRITHVLTSGGQPTALQGAPMIRNMQQDAGEGLKIIAAGRITSVNLAEVHAATGVSVYHGRRIVQGLL